MQTPTGTVPAPQPRGPSLSGRLRRFPATYGLIALTALTFLAQTTSEHLLGADMVLFYGAKVNAAIAAGQVWRLVTPLFVHAGLWHIFINMYSLNAIGPEVEAFFGSARMLAFYLLSGVAGVAMSVAFTPSPSVGASGAIFGLLGALGAFLFLHRSTFGRSGSAQFRQIVIVALLNLGLGLMPGIDNWGHLGGLIAGAGLTLALGPHYEPAWDETGRARLVDHRPWHTLWPGAVIAAALLGLLVVAALQTPVNR